MLLLHQILGLGRPVTVEEWELIMWKVNVEKRSLGNDGDGLLQYCLT